MIYSAVLEDFMKIKTNLVDKRIVVTAIITFFFVAVFLFQQFNNLVDEQLYKAIDDELQSMISHQKLTINTNNTNNTAALYLIAESIEDEIAEDEISDFLSSRMNYVKFNEIFYVDLQGNGISDKGNIENFTQNTVFNKVLELKEHFSGISENSEYSSGVMEIAVPIFQNGEISGVLMAINDVTPVFEMISVELGDIGYILVTDKLGNTVVSSSEKFISSKELAADSTEFVAGSTLEETNSNLAAGISGTSYFVIDGVVRIAKYTPLDFGNMVLLLVAEEAKIQTGIRTISDSVTYLSVGLVVVFLASSIYVWVSKWNSIKKIEKAAYYDDLTGLPNLAKLKKDIKYILQKNKDKKYAVVKFDVDNFKAINEIYGFEIGNKVLTAVELISKSAPEKTLIVARVGTDEFILFAGNDFLEKLDNDTQMYESNFKIIIPELVNHHLTFTYGRYCIEQGEVNVNDIINKVSLAHTMAKGKKECVIWDYDDNYKLEVLNRANITNKMENAMLNGEFHAFLQPKVNIKTNKLVGAEALVRWIESEGKMIFPDKFIPVFENNGFIVKLDMHVLECVCKAIREWIDNGIEAVPVSVNFSRLHLENEKFVQDIKNVVDKYDIAHKYIEVEITETTMINGIDVLKTLIDDLHEEGFKISIDDFGAGYSSLGLLKEFKMDTVKLDRSFINYIEDNRRAELVIEGIVELVNELDMDIVAEGAEDEKQIEFLRSINCDVVQGFYFARPMKISDFEDKFFNGETILK